MTAIPKSWAENHPWFSGWHARVNRQSHEAQLVLLAKQRIERSIKIMRLALDEELIVYEYEDSTFVFPRRVVDGYKQDEDGEYILDANGEKIPHYQDVMYLEYFGYPGPMSLDCHREVEKYVVTAIWQRPTRVMVRIVMPWLVYRVKNGALESADKDVNQAIQVQLSKAAQSGETCHPANNLTTETQSRQTS